MIYEVPLQWSSTANGKLMENRRHLLYGALSLSSSEVQPCFFSENVKPNLMSLSLEKCM